MKLAGTWSSPLPAPPPSRELVHSLSLNPMDQFIADENHFVNDEGDNPQTS